MYLQSIKEAYPNLDIYSARLHTMEGQFNDILFVNDNLIFRFPRYEESIIDFLKEIKILQKLQGHLSLPIPNPIYVSSRTRSVGNLFMGYKLLPGKPLFRETLNAITDQSILESLAQQLANFLCGLHNLSPAIFGSDLPVQNQLEESKSLFSRVQEYLFPFMRPDARNSVISHFDNYFNNASLHDYEPSMIHGDFGGSNILFKANSIAGVIDFSSVKLGDPAIDLAALSTLGNPFFTRVCKYYPCSGSTLERAKFYRGTYALEEALHGFRNNDKEAFVRGMEQYV